MNAIEFSPTHVSSPAMAEFPGWIDALLMCPQCGKGRPLRQKSGFVCGTCSAAYPMANGVAMLLRPDSMIDTAQELGKHLGGVTAEAIQAAFGTALRYRLRDRTLRDEFTQIVERYAAIFDDMTADAASAASVPATSPGKAVLKTEYYNPRFEPGATSFRSFRVGNSGGMPLATAGEKPFHLSYWLQAADGTLIEGVRSRLPIPLLPGRELTIPLRIVAPADAGTYGITVMLVQEYVGWHQTDPVFIGEMVVSESKPDWPDLLEAPHAGFFDFNQDIERCGEMLALAVGMLQEEMGAKTLNVLEVACGNDPQTLRHYQAGTNVVACDLAFPQIQLGALAFRLRGAVPVDRYAFVAADVFNMPFAPASFDLVVVCAALHHFTDVVEALRHLTSLLAPGGKLLLMREPGKVAPEDPTYISELANGFNEQQFVLAEYETMFERAGLAVRSHRMDFECSYKVILERNSVATRPDQKQFEAMAEV